MASKYATSVIPRCAHTRAMLWLSRSATTLEQRGSRFRHDTHPHHATQWTRNHFTRSRPCAGELSGATRVDSFSTPRQFYTTSEREQRQEAETSNAPPQQETTASDLDRLDVMGGVPVPSHSVDLCMADGFQLNSGAEIRGGDGVMLVGGEGFAWRPWLAGDGGKRLVNAKGQWDIAGESLALLSLVWPRPDILILGLGPEIRPLSPAVRRHVASLGMRVDVMDTHNAAAQFNLLVRERGIDEIAAALIPLGWKEGRGAAL